MPGECSGGAWVCAVWACDIFECVPYLSARALGKVRSLVAGPCDGVVAMTDDLDEIADALLELVDASYKVTERAMSLLQRVRDIQAGRPPQLAKVTELRHPWVNP